VISYLNVVGTERFLYRNWQKYEMQEITYRVTASSKEVMGMTGIYFHIE